MTKLFIDGEHGTTGLQIRERIALRTDLEVLTIPHDDRHDVEIRRARLCDADFAILCLPDTAARDAVKMIDDAGAGTRIIDTSTAYRTHSEWAYGFGEITRDHGSAIASAARVSNPGCYSTGAIALLRPLVDAGVLPKDYPLSINAVSGYTGGGKQLIANMENPENEAHIESAIFDYALGLQHKHVPEIISRTGVTRRPIFTPSVGRYAQGMLVRVPLHLDLLQDAASVETIHEAFQAHYAGDGPVKVIPLEVSSKLERLDPEALNGTDEMHLFVFGDAETGHVNLVAQLDNLGKGASGAAVQNLDMMLGR